MGSSPNLTRLKLIQFTHTPTKHKITSPQEAVPPLVLSIPNPRGNPPPPHQSRVLHHNGGQFERGQLVQLILSKAVFACKRLW